MVRREIAYCHSISQKSVSTAALVYSAAGDKQTARTNFEVSLRTYEQLLGPAHPDAGLTLGRLGWVLHDLGDYDVAWSRFERAVRVFEQAFGPTHRFVAENLYGMAAVRFAEGDLPSAVTLALRAEDVANRALDRLLVGMSRRQRLAAVESVRYLDASLSIPSSAVDVERTYKTVLHWKNAVFRSLQTERPLDDSVEADLRHLSLQYDAGRRQLAILTLHWPEEDVQGHLRKIADRSAEVEQLERELSRRSVAFHNQQRLQQATGAEVCKAVPPDGALIEYVSFSRYQPPPSRGEGATWTPSYTAFAVLGDDCGRRPPMRVDLGPAEPIDAAVKQLRAALKIGLKGMTPRPSVQDRARELEALVLPPVLRQVLKGKSRLLIAPDGALALVPFALLPGDDGHEFLIETRTISYTPSGRDLLRFDRARPVSAAPVLLAIGNPDFGVASGSTASLRGTRALCAKDDSVTFDPLPETGREIANITKLATAAGLPPSITLLGHEATKLGLLSELAGKTTLHFATHAYFAGTNCQPGGQAQPAPSLISMGVPGSFGEDPLLLAGLALTGANHDPANGILTALEVTTLDLRQVDLVVLSACDTGVGELHSGQELLGLRWAFALAGARSLVTTMADPRRGDNAAHGALLWVGLATEA